MDRRTEYRDGVLYLIAEDGMAYPMAEVMKYNNPSMDFDPATGDPLGPAAPPAGLTEVEVRAGAKTEPQRRRDQDTFGDTTMRMAAPYLDSAIELAANAGRRPTYFSDPIMGGLERAGQYTGDMALAALSGLGALTYGGAGLMGEVFGGSQSDERMLARDLAAGIDVAGIGPEARALGLLSDAVRAERGGVGNMTRGFLADESGSLPLGKPTLDVSRRDASDIFGAGSERVRYTDPNSGGTIEVVVRPDGSASVLELEVPEAFRGRGIGQTLQARALQDFPKMGGQVSSKAAATTAYRLGRRPQGNPYATLDDVFAAIDDMSSVNMVSPAMQTAPTQTRGFLE